MVNIHKITLRFWSELDWIYRSSSVQFSHSVVSNSLQPHESQHARTPCSSPTPGVYSNSCPLSRCFHPTISSSVVPFSCLQSFPASGYFQMSENLHPVAKVLEFQLQHQSFQWTFRTDLGRTNVLSALSSYLWMWNISFISSYLVSFEFYTFPCIDLLYILLDLYLSISFLSANVSSIVFF